MPEFYAWREEIIKPRIISGKQHKRAISTQKREFVINHQEFVDDVKYLNQRVFARLAVYILRTDEGKAAFRQPKTPDDERHMRLIGEPLKDARPRLRTHIKDDALGGPIDGFASALLRQRLSAGRARTTHRAKCRETKHL
ncbi:MAG: hypothetical protein EXR98_13020 [Gemmataceae bacterium]|nr:hypothetical protein [Gemmataceae bacterium]